MKIAIDTLKPLVLMDFVEEVEIIDVNEMLREAVGIRMDIDEETMKRINFYLELTASQPRIRGIRKEGCI